MAATAPDTLAQSAATDNGWRPWHLWMLGFFLTANIYLVPALANSPRATDLLAALLSIWLAAKLLSTGMGLAPVLALLGYNLLPMIWLIIAYLTGDKQTLILSARWLLAIPWGLALLYGTRRRINQRAFLYGLWWGALANGP